MYFLSKFIHMCVSLNCWSYGLVKMMMMIVVMMVKYKAQTPDIKTAWQLYKIPM